MKNTLLSKEWWKAALARATRTSIVILTPYIPVILESNNAWIGLLAASFGFVTSLLTSLSRLPETSGRAVTWYEGIIERSIKTAAQAVITSFGTSMFFSEVDWAFTLSAVLTSVLGTLLLGVLKSLPETEESKSD